MKHYTKLVLTTLVAACLSIPAMADVVTKDGVTYTTPTEWETVTQTNYTSASGETSGTWQNVTWSFDTTTGTLTLGGKGGIPGYWYTATPWGQYAKQIQKVVIEEGITSVERWSLHGGQMPFTEIELPSTLTYISGYMLQSRNLQKITVAVGGKYYAVDNVLFCKDGDTVTLVRYPGGLTQNSYTVPNGVTILDEYAFSETRNLQDIVLPDSLQSIGYCTFDGCKITTLHIPKNVQTIDASAFTYAYPQSITVDANSPYFTAVDGVLFTKDMTLLHTYPAGKTDTKYTVPEGVKKVASTTYNLSNYLEELYLPDSVEGFQYSFGASSGRPLKKVVVNDTNPHLTSVDGILYNQDKTELLIYPGSHSETTYIMPDTVTTVHREALFGPKNLKQVVLSKNLASIGIDASDGIQSDMYWGGGVTAFYFQGDVPTWLKNCCVSSATTATLYYPAGNTTWTDGKMTVNGTTYTTASYTTLPIASDENPSGTWQNVTWEFDIATATLTIGGTGSIPGGWYSETPWGQYIMQTKIVVVEEGITTIYGLGLNSREMPLTEIQLPSTLTYIDTDMLGSNTLKKITVADGSKYYAINNVLFHKDGDTVTLVRYPRGLTQTAYTVPDGVTKLERYAFYYVLNLQNITLPDSLKSIENGTFMVCSLKTLHIPKNVQTIDASAFTYAYPQSITVDANSPYFTAVDGVLFTKDMTLLHTYPAGKTDTKYTVPEGVKKVASTTYNLSNYLEELYLPDSVEGFQYSFGASSGRPLKKVVVNDTNPHLTSVDGILYNKDKTELLIYPGSHPQTTYVMPDTVTTVHREALMEVHDLEQVILSKNLASFGVMASNGYQADIFWGKNVTAIYFQGDVPTWLSYCRTGTDSATTAVTLYYPAGNTTWTDGTMTVDGKTYKTAAYTTLPTVEEDTTPWNKWENVKWYYDEATATLTIGGTGALPDVRFSAYPWYSVESRMQSLVIAEGITSVPQGAFNSCRNLTSLSLPASLTSFDPNMFYLIQNLNNITTAENGTFYMQDGVLFSRKTDTRGATLVFYTKNKDDASYTVPEGIEIIGKYSMNGVSNQLTSLTLPTTLKTIETQAFNISVTTLHIPAATSSIDQNSFESMAKLTEITVDSASQYYTAIDGILYTKDMKTLVYYPAAHPAETYTLPDTVEEMHAGIFYLSRNLKKFVITKSLNSIWICCQVSSGMVLEEIEVDADNQVYCSIDGVLFSKDKTTLIYYPPKKPCTSYHIPDHVTTIADGCMPYLNKLQSLYFGPNITTCNEVIASVFGRSLRSIYFSGDRPAWFDKAFVKQYDYSHGLDDVTFYYPAGASGWTTPNVTIGDSTSYKALPYTDTPGDLSGDGRVNRIDVALISQWFAGKEVSFDPTSVDFDGDGECTRADGMILARYVAGWADYDQYFVSKANP